MWRAALTLASAGRLSILIFHRVLAEPDPLLPGEPTAGEFDALLAHVKRRFNVLPLTEAIHRMGEGTLPSRALSITFDDGYADNLTVAAPLLLKHGLAATIFIATGYLDGGCMFNDVVISAFRSAQAERLDLEPLALGRYSLRSAEERRLAADSVIGDLKYRPDRDARARSVLDLAGVAQPTNLMLTREAVRRLPEKGIDVGAHTVTHPILARTSADDAYREISDGKRELEELIGRPVTLFAYPNGKPGHDYVERDVRLVRDAGFHAAVTTAWGAAGMYTDPFQLPRFTPWVRDPWKFDLLILRNFRGALGRGAAAARADAQSFASGRAETCG